MSTDVRIKRAVDAMMHAIEAPAVPLAAIREKMREAPLRLEQPRRNGRFAVAAAVAAAALISMLPLISPAVMQGLEARYRAALQALGGIAPPPAPRALISQLKSQTVTLAQAQSRVSFAIVLPSGLPKDVVSSKIVVTPTGIYSKQTNSWRIGPSEVTFAYRRAGSREFLLQAARYDANAEKPGKYVFEARDPMPNGRPVLVKHERFAWRNGDQLMLAVEGPDISASEIRSIQAAMHGVPVLRRELHAPDTSPANTLRMVVRP